MLRSVDDVSTSMERWNGHRIIDKKEEEEEFYHIKDLPEVAGTSYEPCETVIESTLKEVTANVQEALQRFWSYFQSPEKEPVKISLKKGYCVIHTIDEVDIKFSS